MFIHIGDNLAPVEFAKYPGNVTRQWSSSLYFIKINGNWFLPKRFEGVDWEGHHETQVLFYMPVLLAASMLLITNWLLLRSGQAVGETPAGPPWQPRLEVVSNSGGNVTAVAVSGNYAYVLKIWYSIIKLFFVWFSGGV